MAPGLLAAAEKYLLEELKIHCETHLIRQMSAKNCLDLLTLTIQRSTGRNFPLNTSAVIRVSHAEIIRLNQIFMK
jgi:speckle-type POZ protein